MNIYDFTLEELEKRKAENSIEEILMPVDTVFSDYKEILALGKIADVAIISTMDLEHLDASIEAIKLKYDLLLEKHTKEMGKYHFFYLIFFLNYECVGL